MDINTSRRDFLATSLKAGLGTYVLAGRGVSLASAADERAKANLRFGLATYQWGQDWDIPTLIANCTKAGVFGIEPRTSSKYAHGIEPDLGAAKREEIKKRFADSPVKIVSIASGERLDWPEPAQLAAAIAAAKSHLQLSHDLGCCVVRVFPNQFHPEVPREKTIAQIAKSLDELGLFAEPLGQEVSLEAHGNAGELPTIRAIVDQVTTKSVRVRLNCDARDAKGEGFDKNFDLVKDRLSRVIHIHGLKDPKYPYQQMVNLLVKADWDGWALMENSEKVADRVAALIEQRKIWEQLVKNAT